MKSQEWERVKAIKWDKRGRLFWTGGTLNVGRNKEKEKFRNARKAMDSVWRELIAQGVR